MECRTGGELDDFLYLDPKLLKGGDIVPKNRAPFQDAVVFMVGGGNYIEYQNLVDFIKVFPTLLSIKQIRGRTFDKLFALNIYMLSAKAIVQHDEAHHLRRIDAQQCQAVPAPADAARPRDQGHLSRRRRKHDAFGKCYSQSICTRLCTFLFMQNDKIYTNISPTHSILFKLDCENGFVFDFFFNLRHAVRRLWKSLGQLGQRALPAFRWQLTTHAFLLAIQ